MPIRVCCPKCNETADLPDEARGKHGVCNRCGTPVKIPVVVKTLCVFCNADVTDAKHVQDPDKNHVCETCWKGRHPEPPKLQDTLAPAPPPAPEPCDTTTLEPGFATPEPPEIAPLATSVAEHHDDEPHVHDWPYDHRPSPSRRRRPRRARLATTFSTLALLLSACSAYWTWSHGGAGVGLGTFTWEDTHRAQILVLKGQAEILIELGHFAEGIARYEELERLVTDKTIEDPALRDELKAAWHARDTAVAKHIVTQQVAEAAAGDSATITPVETTITLIEEPPDPATPALKKPTPATPTTRRSTVATY